MYGDDGSVPTRLTRYAPHVQSDEEDDIESYGPRSNYANHGSDDSDGSVDVRPARWRSSFILSSDEE